MPWLSTDTVKQRTKFVLEWERRRDEAPDRRVNLSELAREYGVSRQTAYTWLGRYQRTGSLDALVDRSRRPRTTPTKISDEIEAFVVAMKKAYPKWGPRKLCALLVDRYPDRDWPSASCIGAMLKRHGLTKPRRKRRRVALVVSAPFAECTAPNDVWCIDFKGKFRTRDGTWCHALTLVDAYTRYLLRCEIIEPNGREVERVLDSAFQEFGLPRAMRSDNGPPFASTGAGGLTDLSVWWLRLGLELQRIQPGKPQQNGRQERAHRTMEEVVATPAANPRAQQRALDLWRYEYNEVRPHEALRMKAPAAAYEPSRRRYPCKLVGSAFLREPDGLFKLDARGRLRWRRQWIYISSALREEIVQVSWQDDFTHLDVSYGPILLGTIDTEHLERGLRIIRRRRVRPGEVSRMSLD